MILSDYPGVVMYVCRYKEIRPAFQYFKYEVHRAAIPTPTPSALAIIDAAFRDGDGTVHDTLAEDEFAGRLLTILGNRYWRLDEKIHGDFKLPYDELGEAAAYAILDLACSGAVEGEVLFNKYKHMLCAECKQVSCELPQTECAAEQQRSLEYFQRMMANR